MQQLLVIRNEALDIQLKVFEEHKEEDMMEFSHRLEDIKSELEYPCLYYKKVHAIWIYDSVFVSCNCA